MIPRHRLLTGEGGSSYSARRRYFIFELSDSGADVRSLVLGEEEENMEESLEEIRGRGRMEELEAAASG